MCLWVNSITKLGQSSDFLNSRHRNDCITAMIEKSASLIFTGEPVPSRGSIGEIKLAWAAWAWAWTCGHWLEHKPLYVKKAPTVLLNRNRNRNLCHGKRWKHKLFCSIGVCKTEILCFCNLSLCDQYRVRRTFFKIVDLYEQIGPNLLFFSIHGIETLNHDKCITDSLR